MTIAVFNSEELHILKKTWEELSERSDNIGICKNIFLKYIPMNGLLGERLFSQFDKEHTGYISQNNFINCLSILCLGTIAEQSKFLFDVFDVNNTGYVLKKDLITILNYIPSEIFCNCNKKRTTTLESLESLKSLKSLESLELSDNFMTYTNYCHCEKAFNNHKDYLDYDDFCNWIKHTPVLLGYIKSIIPCTAEDDVDINDKFILWKKGEKTGFILKRFCLLKGNCLYYYYNKNDVRPKGIIFLSGSIVEQISDPESESKGHFGFEILQQYDESNYYNNYELNNHNHHHEKRVFYCESNEKRNELIHQLQHLAHIVPFENEYIINKKIGTGAFSEVFECSNILTKEKHAVKIINKSIFNEGISRTQLNNEIAILKLVNHPNIIHLKDTYEDKENIYIVIELIKDGDFLDFINGRPCFNDFELKIIIKQLLEATAYLHEFGIVHCDIKPENILYDKSTGNIIKLTDFGLSQMILSNQKLDKSHGTLQYIAPEILTSLGSGTESDLWSIGIIMYLLANGRMPYDSDTVGDMIKKIYNNDDDNKLLWFKPTVGYDAKCLIIALLEKNPKNRITAKNALLHPFFIS